LRGALREPPDLRPKCAYRCVTKVDGMARENLRA
jgi:hypothetical protein